MPHKVKKGKVGNSSPNVNPMPPEGQYSGAGIGSFMSNVKGTFHADAPSKKPKKSK